MAIPEKIYQLITNLTAEEIDGITQKELKELTFNQVVSYINRAMSLGRNYFIGMVVDKDPPLCHYEMRFGKLTGWLVFDREKKKWQWLSGSGIIPQFEEPPKMVTREEFIKEMVKNGVPTELLDEKYEQPITE